MSKKLIKLEDFNKTIIEKRHSTKNGIECPNCGDELDDVNPEIQLLSSPPKTEIKCFACEYTGYRYC